MENKMKNAKVKMIKMNDNKTVGIIELGTYAESIRIHASKDQNGEFFALQEVKCGRTRIIGRVEMTWGNLQKRIAGEIKSSIKCIADKTHTFQSVNDLMVHFLNTEF
jgi:hypothetical protein